MKKDALMFFGKFTVLTLLLFSFTNCKNSKTNEEDSSHSNDLAIVDSNLDLDKNNKLPDLYYGVDTKFTAVKKSDIDKATTIYAFLNEGEKEQITHVNSVDLIIIKDNQQSNIREYGESDNLTNGQLKLLKSTNYFSHFKIKTVFKDKNKENGKLEEGWFSPHITVVPEKEAVYIDGNEALINYLKENSKEAMNVIKDDQLGSIKISFIVTKEGIVSNVKHDAATTGYSSIDQKFMELIKNIPSKWIPAENSLGEKMDYELVFTFGPRNGC